MKNWELARYLLDAKKSVDSIMFIERNHLSLQHLNLRKKINDLRKDFYIFCVVVIDKSIKNHKERKLLKKEDNIVSRIYKERDKNFAHKDEDYIPKKYNSMLEMIEDMQDELLHVKSLCSETIPKVITLDFIPYDGELFRSMHRITKKEENSILEKKKIVTSSFYNDKINLENENNTNKSVEIFSDTEDFKLIDENFNSDYAIMFENGLTFFEGIQNRQDSCIRLNVLHNTDIWVTYNKKKLEEMMKLKEIGFLNEFDVPNFDLFSEETYDKKMDEIIWKYLRKKSGRNRLAL